MFHFPAYPPAYTRYHPITGGRLPHSDTLGSTPCRQLPEAYRGPTRLSSVIRAQASTICHTKHPAWHNTRLSTPDNTTSIITNDHTKTRHTPPPPQKRAIRVWLQTYTHHTGRCMLASTIQLSNHHPTPHNPSHQRKGNYEAGYYPKP